MILVNYLYNELKANIWNAILLTGIPEIIRLGDSARIGGAYRIVVTDQKNVWDVCGYYVNKSYIRCTLVIVNIKSIRDNNRLVGTGSKNTSFFMTNNGTCRTHLLRKTARQPSYEHPPLYRSTNHVPNSVIPCWIGRRRGHIDSEKRRRGGRIEKESEKL